jgi:predicted Holliday junction resolvase-like endonuclease
VLGTVLGAVLFRVRLGDAMIRRRDGYLEAMLQSWSDDHAAPEAEAAARRSRAVLRGQITEQVVPMFDDFPYDPGDARFIGKPIDFIVFDGYCEVDDGHLEHLREIVFVEVKTGGAALNGVERRIKQCVEQGRVRCEVIELEVDRR